MFKANSYTLLFILICLFTINLSATEEVGFTLTLPNGVSQSEGLSQKFLAHSYSAADRNIWSVGGRKVAVQAFVKGEVLFLSLGARYTSPKVEAFVAYPIPKKWDGARVPLNTRHGLQGSWWKDAYLSVQPLECQGNERVIIIVR